MNTVDFLKNQVTLFKEFPAERLKQLVDGSTVKSFEKDEVIAHQGAEATHYGVVLGGTVNASVPAEGGSRQPLGELSASETFGDGSLLTGDPFLMDFIAGSHCEVLLIPGSF